MSKFLEALALETNQTQTLNGAKAYEFTLNSCLDLFGSIAACRSNLPLAIKNFDRAYSEDIEMAIRILFWCRDIRGGQGERNIFRTLLPRIETKILTRLLPIIAEYGRWDDLLCLSKHEVWNQVRELLYKQIQSDIRNMELGNTISLLAKWMPSNNTSSLKSRQLASDLTKHFGLTPKQYRYTLVRLRQHIKIIESQMCANQWSEIDYEKVPSVASMMYRKAFGKHDRERYSKYLEAVKAGHCKINAATLYPYDIVDKILYQSGYSDTLELLWKNLPNYMDRQFNGLVVADVSGSMYGKPMSVSISLAMYIAERNTGIWKDKFLTFSAQPKLQTIIGSTLQDKIQNLSRAEWGMNTNLKAVFTTILEAAQKSGTTQEEMPEKIFIISDMQFDQCCSNNQRTNFEQICKKYEQAGYILPKLVFWNVNAYANVPITVHDSGTALVSGCSPSILKTILGENINPLAVLRDAVYNKRYESVGQALAGLI